MSASALDTSGVVYLREQVPVGVVGLACFAWEDLSPFVQGYIEAAATDPVCSQGPLAFNFCSPAFGFSDLAPEALAMILRDCEAAAEGRLINSPLHGRAFWTDRQARPVAGFPKLHVRLSDGGKINLSQASGEAA